MIAIMLNDVVVHVDQDSGREEKIGIWWALYFQVFLINKEYSHGYYLVGSPNAKGSLTDSYLLGESIT